MKYKEYLFLILLLLISALNFNLFLKPLKLVCGGTNGLSIIINNLTNIDNSLIILIIHFVMLLLSILLLNRKMTLGLIISTIIYPLFIKVTSKLSFNFNIFLINILIVGILSGISNGFIYKLGFSISGINLLGPLLNKYLNIKIGTINLFINGIIMVLNLILFGMNNFIYSFIVIILNSFIINLILYKKISLTKNKI